MIRSATAQEEGGALAESRASIIPDFTGLLSQGEFHFGIVSRNGVALRDTLSEADALHLLKTALDAWEAVGETHLSITMKVADILNWLESRFGDKYTSEIDMTRRALRQHPKTILNWMGVFKKVLPPVRHPELTYSHHEAVAKLPSDEQREYLDCAASEALTVKELRERIKERHPTKPRASKKSAQTTVAIDTDKPEAVTDALQILANHLDNPKTVMHPDWVEHLATLRGVHMRWMKAQK